MRYGLDDTESAIREDRTCFPAQSSVLDEQALLRRTIADYDIPEPRTCRFLDRGAADIYRVTADGQGFYLKVYRPPDTRIQAESEARFVADLWDRGMPVVRAVARTDGAYAHEVLASEGPRPMLLFEEAPPPLPRDVDEPLCGKLGVALARLHDAADSLASDYDLPTVTCDILADERFPYLKPFMADGDYAYLEEVAARIRPQLETLPDHAPDFGLCHADLVLSNVRTGGNDGITFFDFGNAAYTWRAYELAIVRWSIGNRGHEEEDRRWDAFLTGYASTRRLPAGLADRLPALLILRQLMFLTGNCATLPLRLGTSPFEGDFIANGIARIRRLDEEMQQGS